MFIKRGAKILNHISENVTAVAGLSTLTRHEDNICILLQYSLFAVKLSLI
jgi:hypothetical protein